MFTCLGVLILLLHIIVFVMIVTAAIPLSSKLIWFIVVLLLPVVGPILYLLLGRKARTI
jgi:hypothetical protein